MLTIIKNKKGLTLLETTIALGILMLGILASLTLMLSSFSYIQTTENEIVVVNLAREGLEIVRSIRNNNSYKPDSDKTKIDIFSGAFDGNGYIVDTVNHNNLSTQAINVTNINQCNSGDNTICNLYLTDTGRYTHDPSSGSLSNTKTAFSRLVTIEASPDNYYEKIITSTVSWQVKGRTRTFKIESRLTDWQAK